MLCQFIFKNFKSYREETILDFQATSATEHEGSLLRSEKDRKSFLPVSVLYGPNGGGKSGVLEALNCMVSHVMKPIYHMSEGMPSYTMLYHGCPTFAFGKSASQSPTEFTAFFRHNGFEFRYSIALLSGEITSESLYRKKIGAKRSALIYERDKTGIQLGSSMDKAGININIKSTMPFLSFLFINYNIEIINVAIEWFGNCVFINAANSTLPNFITQDPKEKKLVLKLMQEIDIPISDYIIESKAGADQDDITSFNVYTIRKLGEQDYRLNLFDESQGTVRLFTLLYHVLSALVNGSLLVVDELDNSLHPKLLRYIIKLFKKPNMNVRNAQLLFTSHDISTMTNDVFRRDEIWFATKNEDLISEIYSLYEIRNPDGSHVKERAPFYKQYMEGRYGADPYLQEALSNRWSVEQ